MPRSPVLPMIISCLLQNKSKIKDEPVPLILISIYLIGFFILSYLKETSVPFENNVVAKLDSSAVPAGNFSQKALSF